jgi:creatinine amidohydrolase
MTGARSVLRAAHLPWTRLAALARAGAAALLPVGSTEAHGPHLPLAVDVLIAEEVCVRVSRRLGERGDEAVIFPAVAYSLTDFAAAFAGTVSVSADASRQYLTEVLCGIARHGFRRIAVLNHHLEPAHFQVVHEAARAASEKTGAGIAVPDHRKRPVSARLGEEFVHGGSHAGWYETSLMMAVAPERVDEAARRALPELAVDLPAKIKAGAKDFAACGGPDAYFGNPAAATREDGERLLEVLVETSAAALLALP